MYRGEVGSIAIDTKPDLFSTNNLAVQLNARQSDVIEVVVTFLISGSCKWFVQAANCQVAWLSSPVHQCASLAGTPYLTQYSKTCYLLVLSAGLLTLTLTMQGNASTNNFLLSARQVGNGALTQPTIAPTYDPQNWAQTIENIAGRTQKWVSGYKVRYAITYVRDGVEGSKGPWSDWIQSSYALPTLVGIQTDPSHFAECRKIYRQFKGFPVEQVGTIENNTDTSCPDDNL